MNATVDVTWADGRVTRHLLRGLPDLPDDQLAELLGMDLASYLDPDELPLTPEGWALMWVSVRLGDGDDGRRDAVHGDVIGCAVGASREWAEPALAVGVPTSRELAAVRENRAHPTRYERELNIPAFSAATHARGSRWRPEEMCADQWRQLQVIRARDRERRRRSRVAVEVEARGAT